MRLWAIFSTPSLLEMKPGYTTINQSKTGSLWSDNTRIFRQRRNSKFSHLLKELRVPFFLGQERGCPCGFPLTHDQFCSLFGDIEETEDTNYKSEA
jgi:hypothetical protein